MREPGKATLLWLLLAIPSTELLAQVSENPEFRTHSVPWQKPRPELDVSSKVPSAAFYTKMGLLIVGNTDSLHYSIKVPGKVIKGANDQENLLFSVDSLFFQVQTVQIKQFLGDANFSDPSTILRMHRNWEVDYLRDGPQKIGELFTEEIRLKEGEVVLFWSISVAPGGGTKVTDRLFVSRVHGKSLLVLASAAIGEEEYNRSRKLLLDSMAQVSFSKKRINPKEIQDRLRKGLEIPDLQDH